MSEEKKAGRQDGEAPQRGTDFPPSARDSIEQGVEQEPPEDALRDR
jgi:hypothetical protein